MGDFKNEYKRAADRLEPDSRLIEHLKAEMKSAKNAAPSKPNFFVKYGWVFGSAAACAVVAVAVSLFFVLGKSELSSGGAFINDAAIERADAEMAENASYGGVNGGIADNAGEVDGDWGPVVFEPEESNADYARGEPEAAEDATGNAVITSTTHPSSENFESSYYPMPYVEPQQVEALKPLSYEELKVLMMTDRGESELILSDFSMYDCIEVLGNDKYYLVLRFDYYVFTYPVVAAFQEISPEAPLISLCLYKDYNDLSAYINLREISSLDDLAYFIYPSGYVYSFGDDDLYFEDRDLDQLTPLTDEQFFELVNNAERGSLCLHNFEELEFFDVGFSRYTYTFVCSYTNEGTEKEYFLITHFPDTEYDTTPDYMILRRRRNKEELDLLSEYDTLGRFLAQ